LAALILPLQACTDHANVAGPGMPSAAWVATPEYTSVTVGAETFEIWPWTTGTLNTLDDPVNLIITGEGDPRAVRAALMALGPRLMPPYEAYGVECTWTDAVGDEQASAAEAVDWTGSAIQLACGTYAFRLHLRLFDIGDAILVGAHYEVQVAGTDEHRTLSYALAEEMVRDDLIRTGLVNQEAITQTQQVQPATHRTVEAFIFNLLPGELQMIMTDAPGDVGTDVPIPNDDGMITVVPFVEHYTDPGTGSYQEFTLQYDQGVPKPFCQAPDDWVYVYGPVQIAMTVTIASDGTLERHFRAQGQLSITPIDPTTNPPTPTGSSYTANVTQDHQAWATASAHWVQAKLHQLMVPSSGSDRGQRSQRLRVGSDVVDDFSRSENCGGIGSQ
jgi:hypothetical protein